MATTGLRASRSAVKLSDGARGSCTCTRSNSAPSMSFSRREVTSTGSPRLATPPPRRMGKLEPIGTTGIPASALQRPGAFGGQQQRVGDAALPILGEKMTTCPRDAMEQRPYPPLVAAVVRGDHHHGMVPAALQLPGQGGHVQVDGAGHAPREGRHQGYVQVFGHAHSVQRPQDERGPAGASPAGPRYCRRCGLPTLDDALAVSAGDEGLGLLVSFASRSPGRAAT